MKPICPHCGWWCTFTLLWLGRRAAVYECGRCDRRWNEPREPMTANPAPGKVAGGHASEGYDLDHRPEVSWTGTACSVRWAES